MPGWGSGLTQRELVIRRAIGSDSGDEGLYIGFRKLRAHGGGA